MEHLYEALFLDQADHLHCLYFGVLLWLSSDTRQKDVASWCRRYGFPNDLLRPYRRPARQKLGILYKESFLLTRLTWVSHVRIQLVYHDEIRLSKRFLELLRGNWNNLDSNGKLLRYYPGWNIGLLPSSFRTQYPFALIKILFLIRVSR